MKRCPLPLAAAAATILLVSAISTSASDNNEKEPAPEPYSFSYQAESAGGFSSHQESGDGTGKVQGFYMIMGEDGRERRVDYVADENGYRASISTNEVGTRTESSGDAQYDARLPSQGQLEQAKVTAEEYKYLEDQHAGERARQLANLAGPGRQQQPQQQQQLINSKSDRQQWDTRGGSQAQSGSALTSGQQVAWNQQSQSSQSSQAGSLNSTSDAVQDEEGWRRGARLINNQPVGPSQQGRPVNQLAVSPISSSSGANQQQQQQQWRPQVLSGSPAPVAISGPLADAPVIQRQQAQQAAWQQADRGATPVRSQSTTGSSSSGGTNSNYFQRQLEQQFMQQAYQLTDQDYPRQQVQAGAEQSNADYSKQSSGQQQQQQLFVSQPQVQKPQRLDSAQRATSSGANNFARQRPWQPSDNNNDNRAVAISGNEFSQINQQQNNNVDEPTGEQVDTQVNTSDEAARNTTSTSSTSTQLNQAELVQQNLAQQQQQPQPQRPQLVEQPQFESPVTTTTTTTTTTTSRPAPSGFFSIDLNQDNSTTTSAQGQMLNEEVDNRQTGQQAEQNFFAKAQTSSGGQKTSSQSVKNQGFGNFKQVTAVSQQQQLQQSQRETPAQSSTGKQVAEIVNSQREGGSYVGSNQGKQQASFQNVLAPTSTEDSQVDTTTDRPEQSTVTTQQQSAQQQFVAASQSPNIEIATTTTTTTSQRPTVIQQYVTSRAPTRVSDDTTPSVTLTTSGAVSSGQGSFFQRLSERPTAQRQQVDGVKGARLAGSQRGSSPANFKKVTEPIATLRAPVLERPTSEYIRASEMANSSSISYQKPAPASERPDVIDENRLVVVEQANKQSSYNQPLNQRTQKPQQQAVAYQRPTFSSDYSRQRKQSAYSEIGTSTSTTSTTTTTSRPTRLVAATSQSQQLRGGVKGGAKSGRRQFWLQQLQQQPLIPSDQRVFPLTTSQQPAEGSSNQASVDYATSVSSYGSRIAGR